MDNVYESESSSSELITVKSVFGGDFMSHLCGLYLFHYHQLLDQCIGGETWNTSSVITTSLSFDFSILMDAAAADRKLNFPPKKQQ